VKNTVYIGGSMNAMAQIRERNKDMEARGFTVLSTWATRDESGETPLVSATVDWMELMRSNLVVICAEIPSSSGGFMVETGAAIAFEKPVIYITGEQGTMNVFASLPSVSIYRTWSDYLTALDSARRMAEPRSLTRVPSPVVRVRKYSKRKVA
jgi:hypothetical protein